MDEAIPRLARLAGIARQVAAEWGLTLGEPLALGRSSYVVAVDDMVLKVVEPHREAEHEADALALWNGDGAVRLLRHDRERWAFLLERARPGTDLSALSEHEAADVALDVGRRLWRRPPPDAPFWSVANFREGWLDVFRRADHPLAPAAERALAKLELRAAVVVHGDFHHYNMLRRGSGWAAIDPKPIIAEPEFDVATYLWNPLETEPTPERTAFRLDAFTRAGLDRERMHAWAIVRGVELGLDALADGWDRVPQLEVVKMLL